MGYPAIQCQIVIDSSNKYLNFDLNPTGAPSLKTATLTAATYADIHALISHINTVIHADVVATLDVAVSSTGVVSFLDDDSDFEILWNTGANAGSTTGPILGFTVTADSGTSPEVANGTYGFYSNYQHQYGWYAPHSVSRDTGLRQFFIGGKTRYTLNRTSAKRLYIGTGNKRTMDFNLVRNYKTFEADATGSYTNQAFESVWERMVRGESWRYYPDAAVTATYTTFYLDGLDDLSEITRPVVDSPLYNIKIQAVRDET